MDNERNLRIYRLWSPVYDVLLQRLFSSGRKRAITLLDLKPGETLLIPGIGTGQDLPLLPPDIKIIGGDLSQAMLAKARQKIGNRNVDFCTMDAQKLDFPDASFDAILLNLILSVVPDGKATLRESWRVLCPGGRIVIFDKFLPEGDTVTSLRRLVGGIMSTMGTDPNRRLSDLLDGLANLVMTCNEPSLFGGQYRVIRLDKTQ